MRVRYKNREWCLVACGEIKIDHKELGRVLPEEVADTDKELHKLIASYKSTQSSPRQVAGDDTVEGIYDSNGDHSLNRTKLS